jgi:hypothetical protein
MNQATFSVAISESQILHNNESRKRPSNPHLWNDAVRKRRRNSGEPYVSRARALKPGKIAPTQVLLSL